MSEEYLTDEQISEWKDKRDENWGAGDKTVLAGVVDKTLAGLNRLNTMLKPGVTTIFYQAEHDELYLHGFDEVNVTEESLEYLYLCGIYPNPEFDCFFTMT